MNATAAITANPFALMVTPEQVLQTMEQSRSLRALHQQQFRPLDRDDEEDDAPAAALPSAAASSLPETEPWLRGMTRVQASLYRAVLA
ncbi:hypothetical protein PY257_04830 [Ramlibacter sp. H39-3-26]|uniref:hypothetical protein n=1 Tax=Curvibacter soli TaxID=3031331 RepID=UPI0023DA8F8A|nr:hypothetical protein [Ramlibacter sp. H39-3-26]MDF1484510.1 hypothetical protein [Ramlibacter sp. H39-3-26]